MTAALIGLAAAAVVLAVLARRRAGRPDFELRLHPHGATVRRGEVPDAFLASCTEVARIAGIERGWIRGYGTAAAVRLRFSASIPEPVRQRFRNVWPHGAPPAPRPPRPGAPRRRARG